MGAIFFTRDLGLHPFPRQWAAWSLNLVTDRQRKLTIFTTGMASAVVCRRKTSELPLST